MDFLTNNWQEIGTAFLAVIGGLKILARYTKTQIDDKIIGIFEWPLAKLIGKK